MTSPSRLTDDGTPVKPLSHHGHAVQLPERSDHLRAGLQDILSRARGSALGLSFWIIVCLGSSVLYLLQATPQYVATAQVVLEPRRPVSGNVDLTSSNNLALDGSQADSQIQVIRSERNLRFVFDTLENASSNSLEKSPDVFKSAISALAGRGSADVPLPPFTELSRAIAFQNFTSRLDVSRLGQSYVLSISYRALAPQEASRIANAIAASYLRGQVLYRAASIERGTEYLQNRISDINGELASLTNAVRSGVIEDRVYADADARLISAATPPLAKSSPQSKLIVAFTLVFSIATALVFLLIRYELDDKVRTRRQLVRTLNLECLSDLPRVRSRNSRLFSKSPVMLSYVISNPDSDFARMIRVLRAALFAARPSQPNHLAVGVLSFSETEGRTVVAANLAFSLAASSDRTALVDGDLRKPTLTRTFAPDAVEGLSEVLIAKKPISIIPRLPIGDGLVLIPAVGASQRADPNVFLGSSEVRDMILSLKLAGNVVVDLPPLQLSSDAQAIGHLLDGVVLVAEVNRTLFSDLREVVRSLRSLDIEILGVVINKTKSKGVHEKISDLGKNSRISS